MFLLIWLAACGEPAPDHASPPEATARDLVAALDAQIENATELSEEHRDWTRLELLAGLHEQRARLVGGNFDDYARAQDTIDRAFAIAPDGSGPWLTKASLDFTLHRLDAVEPSLQMFEKRILIDESERGKVAQLRADVALQRGDYTAAETLYTEAETHKRTMGTCYGFVQLAWWKAQFDEAQAKLDGCNTLVPGHDPQTEAWLDVQRGLIETDRRDYAAAERHYIEAAQHVAGWFLVDESLADARWKMGRTAEAEAAYRDIIARNASPQAMDALASILIGSDRAAEGHAWAEKADVLWRNELVRFPEATYAHALEHFYRLGSDPAETLELARDNVRVRPNGAARVMLARELLAAGDAVDARAEVDAILRTPYRSAELAELDATLAR